jgi:hypothetical protein
MSTQSSKPDSALQQISATQVGLLLFLSSFDRFRGRPADGILWSFLGLSRPTGWRLARAKTTRQISRNPRGRLARKQASFAGIAQKSGKLKTQVHQMLLRPFHQATCYDNWASCRRDAGRTAPHNLTVF